MYQNDISILNLPIKKKAIISSIHGGYGFQRKLHVMGIRPGQSIRVVSAQPFKGPITIEVCGCQMTLGRGMAKKIFVED
jgi:Fe2+ transport system protein FeoA